MKARFLSDLKVDEFVTQLLTAHVVIGPKRDGDFSLYASIAEASELDLRGERPRMSAKAAFFPQTETLLVFETGASEATAPGMDKPQVLLGALACDLKGIETQDKVFMEGAFRDSYYVRRRANTVIFGLACVEMLETCFCNSFGIDPWRPQGCDCAMAPVSGGFVCQPYTDAANALIAGLPEASEANLEDVRKSVERFEAEQNPLVPVEEFSETMAEVFESPEWEEAVEGCLGCNVCAFVCPTCHCFDIADETLGERGRRLRTWDGCMASKFTLHASGHDPRTKAEQRLRQRMLHKFQYMKKNIDMLGCSGCGRCSALCPGGWDIREIIARLGERLKA